jgi:ribosomal protein L37AE/L43A
MRNSRRSVVALVVTLVMVLSSTLAPLGDMPLPAAAPDGGTTGRGGDGAGGGAVGPNGGADDAATGNDRASAGAGPSIIYAILCPEAFKSTLGPLKDWKTKKGMNAEIYTLEEMTAAYIGSADDRAFIKVHQFLRRLYVNNSELKWVLIAGDGDAGFETFPVPYIFTNASHDPVMGDSSVADDVPSDVMYSGLEKGWDANGNGLFGEPGEADWTPEVYVGRWPSKSVGEVSANVNKVLTYEKNPPAGDWVKSALLAGALYDLPNILDATKDPNAWNNNVYDWPHDNGRTPMLDSGAKMTGMDKTYLFDYNQTYGGNYTNAADNLTAASFLAKMDAGCSIVATASHGWYSGNGINQYFGNGSDPDKNFVGNYASFIYWSDAQALSNGMKLPLMYSSSCDVGNFAAGGDQTLEQLLKNPNGGAIGFISSTNGDYWHTKDGNWWLEVNFWDIFFKGSFRPGESLYLGKVAYDNLFKQNGWNNELARVRQNKAIYILLGDPEVPIWTDTPGTLSIEAPARMINARQTANVTVRDGMTGKPVSNAMVAFTGAGAFARGFTNASGIARVLVEPTDTGMINLTVTAHNYLPSEQQVEVVAAPPDLADVFGEIKVQASGPVIGAGEQVTISAVIDNIGGQAASGVPVSFYDGDPAKGGNVIGSITIPDLPAHKNATAQIIWTATSGTKAIYVWADPANEIAELDESNNVASVAITISGLELTITSDDISVTPTILFGGQPTAATGTVLATCATVHNLGSDSARNIYVRFYDGDPRANGSMIEGDKRIDVINASGTGIASVSWNGTSLAGARTIFVVVNPKNSVGHVLEYNDTNNEASLSILLNAPPRFTQTIEPQSTEEDRARNNFLDMSAFVTDPDNDVSGLIFRVVSSTEPGANVSLTPQGMLSIRSLPDWNGMTVVTVGVSDGISEVFSSFNFTVQPVNDPPVMDPVPDATLQVGDICVINITARDPDIDDGDVLTFSAETDFFTINRTSGRIIYTPSVAHVGKRSVKITVTDSGMLSAFSVWKFTVVRPNSPPRLQTGENLSILGMETKPLYYKFNATDPEGDALTFSVDTGMFTVNPATGEVNFTPPKGTAGSYKFNVTVRDTGGLSDTRVVTLVIAKLPPADGTDGSAQWPIYLVLILVAAICVGIAGVMAKRIRGRSPAGRKDGSEKERYEAIYGVGTYEYAKKGGSSSLREFRENESAEKAAVPPKCPRCGSTSIQKFPDGGAICNKCGTSIKEDGMT